LKQEKEVVDLYEWLPEYGENSVSFHSHGKNVILTVEYDIDDSSLGEYARRNIIFESVCSFEVSTFPGIVISTDSDVDYDQPEDDRLSLGSLREYTDSKVADMWTQHFKNQYIVRHFQILFLSENKRFEMFAKEVIVSDEEYFS